MIDEGYIKYQCNLEQALPPDNEYIAEINFWRQKLYRNNLIGVYKDVGIGFGNISVRHPDNKQHFIISGTQTGHLPKLSNKDYSLVTVCNIGKNYVSCRGLIKSSSEALTHHIIYGLHNSFNAVVHVHHPQMWHTFKNTLPTTPADTPYGTAEMALAVKHLYDTNALNERIIIMAGHEDGIITFGNNLAEASDVLFHYLSKIQDVL